MIVNLQVSGIWLFVHTLHHQFISDLLHLLQHIELLYCSTVHGPLDGAVYCIAMAILSYIPADGPASAVS